MKILGINTALPYTEIAVVGGGKTLFYEGWMSDFNEAEKLLPALKRAINKIGMFDEDLFMYAEEPDVCHRMRKAGWEIWFVRDLEITHYRRDSIRQKGKLVELFSRSMFIWMKKRWLVSLAAKDMDHTGFWHG